MFNRVRAFLFVTIDSRFSLTLKDDRYRFTFITTRDHVNDRSLWTWTDQKRTILSDLATWNSWISSLSDLSCLFAIDGPNAVAQSPRESVEQPIRWFLPIRREESQTNVGIESFRYWVLSSEDSIWLQRHIAGEIALVSFHLPRTRREKSSIHRSDYQSSQVGAWMSQRDDASLRLLFAVQTACCSSRICAMRIDHPRPSPSFNTNQGWNRETTSSRWILYTFGRWQTTLKIDRGQKTVLLDSTDRSIIGDIQDGVTDVIDARCSSWISIDESNVCGTAPLDLVDPSTGITDRSDQCIKSADKRAFPSVVDDDVRQWRSWPSIDLFIDQRLSSSILLFSTDWYDSESSIKGTHLLCWTQIIAVVLVVLALSETSPRPSRCDASIGKFIRGSLCNISSLVYVLVPYAILSSQRKRRQLTDPFSTSVRWKMFCALSFFRCFVLCYPNPCTFLLIISVCL